MHREIWDVQKRCLECGAARAVVICETGKDEEGQSYREVFVDVIPHGNVACRRMTALAREEWPRLF